MHWTCWKITTKLSVTAGLPLWVFLTQAVSSSYTGALFLISLYKIKASEQCWFKSVSGGTPARSEYRTCTAIRLRPFAYTKWILKRKCKWIIHLNFSSYPQGKPLGTHFLWLPSCRGGTRGTVLQFKRERFPKRDTSLWNKFLTIF